VSRQKKACQRCNLENSRIKDSGIPVQRHTHICVFVYLFVTSYYNARIRARVFESRGTLGDANWEMKLNDERQRERETLLTESLAERGGRRGRPAGRLFTCDFLFPMCVARAALRCTLVPKRHQGQALRTGLRKSRSTGRSLRTDLLHASARLGLLISDLRGSVVKVRRDRQRMPREII